MVERQKLQEEEAGVEKSCGYGRCKVRSKKNKDFFLFVYFIVILSKIR